MKSYIVYYSHPMELDGQGLLDDSGRRAREAQKLLGPRFKVWVPEDNQVKDHMKQQKVDLDALLDSDIILVDFYHFGLIVNGGQVLGKGTNQEVGFAKALNKVRSKKIPIVQIIRQKTNFHCFDVEGYNKDYGVTKNVQSLEEACEFLRKMYVQ